MCDAKTFESIKKYATKKAAHAELDPILFVTIVRCAVVEWLACWNVNSTV